MAKNLKIALTALAVSGVFALYAGGAMASDHGDYKDKKMMNHKEHAGERAYNTPAGKIFENHDTDGDGKISKEEFLSEAESRFDKNDYDNDGYISKEEAKEFHEKMREKMKYRAKERRERMEERMEDRRERMNGYMNDDMEDFDDMEDEME